MHPSEPLSSALAPRRSSHRRRRRWPAFATTLAVFLGAAAFPGAAPAQSTTTTTTDQRIDLPDLGNSAENFLSDGEEREYARAILMQMRAFEIMVEDPLIADFFADMGYRLVAHSDRPTMPFHFVVLDEKRVNAFAAPGGVVALHSGLILAAEDEHEVAGVLAHEIAHVTQLHIFRTLQNTQDMTIPIALGMLALVLAGGGSGEAITGALLGGTAMQQQVFINFTRANEAEADRLGILTLSQAGYDPKGMADFFERINRINRPAGEAPPEFLRTHPVTTNRIAEAKDRAASLPVPETGDGLDFYLAQARLRALFEDQPEQAIAWFRDELEQTSSTAQLRAHQYGLAVALQREREFDEARQLLERLLASDPYKLAYLLQAASLDLETGEGDRARASLADLHHGFPGNHAIAVQYAEALLSPRDPELAAEAAEVLRGQLRERNDNPRLHELHARASALAGDDITASEALAESYFLSGSVEEAMQQLEMLKDRDDLDYYQRARITTRLDEMRIIMADFGEATPG
ncbi:MAG: M48 family metalloprotease [Xanthomonadales bacterium]|nr:M48 family metalloprotease [Xanthomonadales bacterium]